MPKKVFLWDIDGTLLLTGGAGKTAFQKVFRDLYGILDDVWGDYGPHGKTDYAIIDVLYSRRFGASPAPEESARIAAHYRVCFEEDLLRIPGFRLMPRAKETIEALSARPDVSLGLATGNFKEAAYLKLKAGGLEKHFAYGGFGCDALERVELTRAAYRRAVEHIGGEPVALYLVGDTVYDVRCGQAIGAKTVGVCTGGNTRKELEDAGATWVIDDLTRFFETIGSFL